MTHPVQYHGVVIGNATTEMSARGIAARTIAHVLQFPNEHFTATLAETYDEDAMIAAHGRGEVWHGPLAWFVGVSA